MVAPLWMLPDHWSVCEQESIKKYNCRGELGQLVKGLVQPALGFRLCPRLIKDYRNILSQVDMVVFVL